MNFIIYNKTVMTMGRVRIKSYIAHNPNILI